MKLRSFTFALMTFALFASAAHTPPAPRIEQVTPRVSVIVAGAPINVPVNFNAGPMPDMPSGGGQPPDIPQFASGGIIEPKPGSTIARVAEAGQAEFVAPVRAFSECLA